MDLESVNRNCSYDWDTTAIVQLQTKPACDVKCSSILAPVDRSMPPVNNTNDCTVADSYGEFELAALYREIEKIPRLQL